MVPGLVAVMVMTLGPSSTAFRCPSAASESAGVMIAEPPVPGDADTVVAPAVLATPAM